MSDIFREVEEDVRRERFRKLWKQYGDYVIVAAAIVVIGVAGYVAWQRYDAGRRVAASAQLLVAQNLSAPGPAEAAFAKLAQTAPGGYRRLALLEQADSMIAEGKTAPAVDLLKSIAHDDSGPLGAVARLRAAWALADTAPRGDLETLLAPLTPASSAWSEPAREVLAYSDYRAAKTMAAQTEYQSLADDAQAPDSLRQRARAMVEFLKSGGAVNYGTVPPLPPPPAPGVTAPGAAPTIVAAPPNDSTNKGAAKP